MNLKSRSSGVILSLLMTAHFAQAQMKPDDLLKLPVTPGGHIVRYGGDALQFGELRVPEGKGLAPIVVLVHGGCWVDRLPGEDPRITTYELLRPLASALTSQGVATWNIEYRRSGSPGGGWPATYLDLGKAIDALRDIAVANHLDLSRVVVVGHSSGGQFALWMGARAKLPAGSEIYTRNPLKTTALVDIDGPAELASAQPLEKEYCPVPGISQLMEGKPSDQPVRYREGAAEAFLPLGVPQVLVAGALLNAIAPAAQLYAKEAEAKGDTARVMTLEKSGHFDMLNPTSPYGLSLISTVLAEARAPAQSKR